MMKTRLLAKRALLLLPVLIVVSLLRMSLASGVEPVDRKDPGIQRTAGIVYYNGTPFTGMIKNEQAITEYVDGLRHGISESWYGNGQKNFSRSYLEGVETGTHTGWWEDGSLRFRYNFESGVHHGSSKDWFADGTLFRDFNYENGYEAGRQQMYFEDGTLRANYEVRNGRRYGLMGTKPCTG